MPINTTPEVRRTTFDLPRELHKQLKVLSVIQERDMRDIVVEAIQAHLGNVQHPGKEQKAA